MKVYKYFIVLHVTYIGNDVKQGGIRCFWIPKGFDVEGSNQKTVSKVDRYQE